MKEARRPLLATSSVRALFGENNAAIAVAVCCTRQAVALWGRHVPELPARRLLDNYPELRPLARWVRAKPLRKPRS